MANRKITDLTELTTPASDDVIPIVDVSETSNATKNKKITAGNLLQGTPSLSLQLANGTQAAPSLSFTSATSTGLYRSAANELSIATNGGQAIKVEADNKTTIYGDLVVTGGTTTISSTQIDVNDKNLQLATGNSSDSGADGGGLTVKGASDKTWNWVDSTDAWTANQHIDVTTGKVYKIAGTEVLNATTLGSGVVSSSLTSVGTLGSLTVTNAVTAGSLDISGGADIDGTLEADAYTVNGTALNEYIADTVGAMVSSNTETNITVTYDDADNTLDFVIGTLNQDTTGNAATATALETARTIGGVSFNGTANINLPGVNQTGNQNTTGSAATLTTARTIGGVSFDGSANINLPGVNAAGNQNTSGTAAGLSGTPNITVGVVTGGSLDISGDADIDGTLEADAITVDGTALNEFIADTVGGMVSSNTETNIAVTYDDSDNTLDFVISSYPAASISGTTLASNVVTSSLTSVGTLGSLTVTNAVTAGSLDISGGVDVDGTLEADAITVDGTALNEYIADTVGAMVSSNTETNIVVTYDDSDNTLDFSVVNITGNAATATALQNARTIGGVSFDGTANIDLPGVNTAGNQNTSGTAANLSGTPNITVGIVTAASLDISGNADIDGILEADAITVDGTALDEFIADTIGAMVSSNTETNITVTYDDSDNTLDFVIGTLNQDTTGTAALATEFTVTANNSTDETVYPTFVDGATGSQGAETDTALTYNPSTGLFTSTVFGGSGANLTNLNASQLSSGTIAAARLDTATTQSASNNSTKIATTAYVDTAVSNLVDGSPGALNTLNELAAALGDDANFSTTVTNSIATKLPLAGGTLTGALTVNSEINARRLTLSDDGATSPTFMLKTDDASPWGFTIKNDSYSTSADVGLKAYQGNNGAFNIRLQGNSEYNSFYLLQHNGSSERQILVFNTSGNASFSGSVTATGGFSGSGASLTSLNASNISSGTIAAARVPTLNQSTTGNAATATALATARAINGVNFDGTADITVTAAAGTLSGNTLASGVTASSLTSVGTLTGLSVSGDILMTGTGAIDVPTGTTAQRPSSPTTGAFRYNSTDAQFEGYTASGWGAIAGGSGGGASDFQYLALRNSANDGAASYPASDFTLVTSGTSNAISPTAANTLLVSIGGVIQQPNTGTSTPTTGFAISGSTIKFGSNISAAPDFIIYQLGAGIGTPSDNAVTEAKLNVSNSPTNGYFLQAQSGTTGGLTWAAAPANDSSTGIDFDDNVQARWGTDNDLVIHHDGTRNIIDAATSKNTDFYYGGSQQFWFGNAEFKGIDNKKIILGTHDDLQLYHASNISTIKDNYGDLRIMGNTIRIQRNAGGENFFYATEGGKTSLYYDGGEKLQTTDFGITTTGRLNQQVNSSTTFPTSFGTNAYNPYDHELVIDNNTQGNEGSFAGIYFNAGADSDGSKVGTARISAVETGNYKADLVFGTRNTSFAERMRITADGKVGIGTADLHCVSKGLHIKTNDSGVTSANANRDDVFIEGNDNVGITIASANDKVGGIGFDDPDGAGRGRIQYAHGSDQLQLYAEGQNVLKLTDGIYHWKQGQHQNISNTSHIIWSGGTNSNVGGNVCFFSGNHGSYPGAIRFRADASERLWIHKSGDIQISDGNLKVANGHGIDFSATGDGSGTANQELLDDYEEGVWIPGLTFGNGNTGLSLSTATGRYTKIGREITAGFVINLSAVGSSTGTCRITGLPYTAINDSGSRVHGEVTYYGNMSNLEGSPYIYGNYNSTAAVIYDNGSDVTSDGVGNGNFNNNSVLRGIIWYKAA